MKRFYKLLSAFLLALLPLVAQAYDESFVFIDENGNVLEDGAYIVRNVVETATTGEEVIYSGLSVKNVSAGTNDGLKVCYSIEQIDNGAFQICFPTTCNMKNEMGYYETSPGQLMGEVQDLMSEWFPTADGSCIVILSIVVMNKSGFPPTYTPKDTGPTVIVEFVKGGAQTLKGDVNGDGEVGISDINALIDNILSGTYESVADVDGDGEVAISDINTVIDIILSKN